jgi:hypothetical protein
MHSVAWYDTASSLAAATVGASSRSAGANSREILDRQVIGMTPERKVDFIAADNPTATKFTIHILAAVAEHKRDAIT